jgi:hypothetical protein
VRNIDHIELPDEIAALITPAEETLGRLETISKVLEDRKKEAIDGRMNSGIEDVWAYCEEAYAGIDDANRGEFNQNRWIKPTHMSQPVTTANAAADKNDVNDGRSTAFVRLTSRYVDAGYAKVGEILLPIDDKAFSFTPTPVPDLIKGLEDTTPVLSENGQPLMRPARPDELGQVAPPPVGATTTPPPDVPVTTKDVAEEAIEQAKKKAKKAELRIYDQMIECGHHREMRKVLFDASRLGVGILKGPFPIRRRRRAMVNGAVIMKEEIVPADKWVDPWNFYPDPACGEEIKNGDYSFERDFFSDKQVRDLIGQPGYIESQLLKVLANGPVTKPVSGKNPVEATLNKTYVVWFYYGTVKRADFEVINAKAAQDIPEKDDTVYAVLTMINDIVVHGTINPLAKSGEIPYHAVPWLRRPGSWAGVGVAEQLVTAQRVVNAASRSLLNNAGVSAGPQIVINRKGIRPANGEWVVTPNKIWYMSEDSMTDDVEKAFITYQIDSVEGPLLKIVEYGMRLAEESTNIPLVTQGLSGKTQPETLGGMQLQDNNANQLLRNVGYGFDGHLTVPLVHQWYEYHLLDPNVPDGEKGDFAIHAHGSVALVERSIRAQFISQMTPIATPQYGVNPKKWFAVVAKANHLDPTEVQFTPEEQAKMDSIPPPKAPAVEVAEIKAKISQMQMQADQVRAQEEDALARELAQLDAQSAQEIETVRNQTAQLRIKLDTDRDTVYAQAETDRVRTEFIGKMKEIENKKQLAQEEFALKHRLNLDQIKQKLADTAMKLNVQKELAAQELQVDLKKHVTPSAKDVIKPPTNRPGKASQGKAFSQV